MPDFFNTGKPEASNLPMWKREVKLKAGDTVRFIPLHGVDECFGVNIHGKQVKSNDRYFDVVCGMKNSHLFEVVPCPFDTHPDEVLRKVKTKQFMLVYVISGPDSDMNGKVGYIHLRYGVKASGAFDTLKNWEKIQSNEAGNKVSVEGQKIVVMREGSGFQNTTYPTNVMGAEKLPLTVSEVTEQVTPIVEYLKGLYGTGITAERLQELYTAALVGNVAPKQKDQPHPEVGDDVTF